MNFSLSQLLLFLFLLFLFFGDLEKLKKLFTNYKKKIKKKRI